MAGFLDVLCKMAPGAGYVPLYHGILTNASYLHILSLMKPVAKHDCKEELHNAKLRVTPARLGVLAMLEQTDVPVDVSMIADYLKKQKIAADEVTVFRILNTFTDKGITKPIQLNEGKLRYEYAHKAKHHHFFCEKCKTITDVEGCTVSGLERQIEETTGGKVTRHSLEFFGLCRRCIS